MSSIFARLARVVKKCGTMTMSVLQSEFVCTCCQGSVGNRDPFPEVVSERACFTISGLGLRHSDRCHCDSFQDHPNDQWHQGYKGLSTKVTWLIFLWRKCEAFNKGLVSSMPTYDNIDNQRCFPKHKLFQETADRMIRCSADSRVFHYS